MSWTLFAQIPLLVLALWFFTGYMTQTFPTLRGKRICLLIAHPDDEAMFFAPTVQYLTQPHLRNRVFVLCLSSGDADGLGHVRKHELVESARILGVGALDAEAADGSWASSSSSSSSSPRGETEKYVVVVEHERLPDSMTASWDAKFISSILARYFAPDLASTPVDQPPTAKIDALVTFDQGGVSGHPNHISLYHGARTFITSLMARHAGWQCPVAMYTLTSVNFARKYSGVLDCVATLLAMLGRVKDRSSSGPTPLVMVSSPIAVRKAQRAMTDAHVSQMRWFRWGWIVISRYMYVNDLSKERVSR